MTTPNGGPAFPTLGDDFMKVADGSYQPKSHYGMQGESGMTLRDWFAGMALQGILAGGGDYDAGLMEREAYQRADAMLAAKEATHA